MSRSTKRLLIPLLAALAGLVLTIGYKQRPLPPIEVYFSPKGGVTEAVVDEIDRARQTILVQAFSFTSKPIAEALWNAHKRGVNVQLVLDSSHLTDKYSEADFFLHAGIKTLIDGKHAIAHNKIMILDGAVVITGSFNFTKQAEQSNAENLLVIRDAALARRYAENWQQHAAHSEPYQGQTAAAEAARAEEAGAAPAGADDYISTSTSSLFHKPTCRSAGRIAEKNRLRYGTRFGALLAGKEPCPECKP